MANAIFSENPSPHARLDGRTLLGVLLLYGVSVFCATYPALLAPTSRLAGSRCDPLQGLWLMRWYKDCALHGHSPLLCDGMQYPVGAPLGNFSPLHFQTLLYLVLSLFTANDILCYNAIWFFNMCFTGLASFVLAWYVVQNRLCACFAGLLAMLSGPVLLHAHGHIELITLGWLPLFLIGWMRWLEQPTLGRLLVALMLYFLVALSAAYFAVFALVPAAVFLIGRASRGGYRQVFPWFGGRIGGLSTFVMVAAVGSCLIYFPQILSRSEGYSLPRPKGEFNYYGAPPWSYLMPSYLHRLGRLLPADCYAQAGTVTVECCSYLGVVMLFLLSYAAIRRARLDRAGLWWSVVLVCVVLSFGAYWRIGSLRISLPAEWLRKGLFVFQALRVPARFNLCVSVFAAVPVAAGLRDLLARFRSRGLQVAMLAALTLIGVADLAVVPFQTSPIPKIPACYAMLQERKPGATIVEVPQLASGICAELGSACTYWQAWHRCRTTGGYSGYDNVRFDNLIWQPSPFAWPRMGRQDFWNRPESMAMDLVSGVRFEDYVWLYLMAHRLDFLVLHHEPGLADEFLPAVEKLAPLLRHACIFEDGDTSVYDRALLRMPQRPTLLCTDGWRHRTPWRGSLTCVLGRIGQIAAVNPDPGQLLTLTLDAVALHRTRTVRLLAEGEQLARWDVAADQLHDYTSPPFVLPAGISRLILLSDSEERPTRQELTYEGDTSPYSLRVAHVGLYSRPSHTDEEPE